jgi:POT family proton-dependent oligopeptide transporter
MLSTKTISEAKKLARGPYVVIAAVLWEFFSYFGMRALLVLYLIQKLKFLDQSAYALFGAFISMIFVSPILGGWLADRIIGYRRSVYLGALLIMFGHITLGFQSMWSLYLGLALIVTGIGFFKSSALCMLNEYCKNDTGRYSGIFTMYYVGGNIGATIAPILCGYFAAQFGWNIGFLTAGIGMSIGILGLIICRKYMQGIGNPTVKFNNKTKSNILLGLIGLILLIGCYMIIIKNCLAGYVIIAAVIISVFMMFSVYTKTDDRNKRKMLLMTFILTLFGTAFWIFDQQGGSSISVFILRFVNRNIGTYTIPAAMFQSINPAVIIIFGSAIAWFFSWLNRKGIKAGAILKVLIGTLMLTLGFGLIAFGANIGIANAKISSLWVITGLTLIGSAEIFIDPVILSVLACVAPQKSKGSLTAIYYLFVGAIANYLSAQVAKLTAIPKSATILKPSITLYRNLDLKIVLIGAIMTIILIVLMRLFRPSHDV